MAGRGSAVFLVVGAGLQPLLCVAHGPSPRGVTCRLVGQTCHLPSYLPKLIRGQWLTSQPVTLLRLVLALFNESSIPLERTLTNIAGFRLRTWSTMLAQPLTRVLALRLTPLRRDLLALPWFLLCWREPLTQELQCLPARRLSCTLPSYRSSTVRRTSTCARSTGEMNGLAIRIHTSARILKLLPTVGTDCCWHSAILIPKSEHIRVPSPCR